MIHTSLSPNTEREDILRAVGLIFQPWKWKRGSATHELEQALAEYFGVEQVKTFESGRTALYTILKAYGIGQGDEILLQAYTCVAVPEPILWAGATPVYVDCSREYFTVDPIDLEKKITPKTKAIIVQHTFGCPADMDLIMDIASKHNLIVIEDCAHALGADYKGKKVGTIGDVGFFSFGRDKVLSSVFGGFTTTNDRSLADKISAIHAAYPYPTGFWIRQQLMHPPILALSKLTYRFFKLGRVILEASKRLHIISLAVERKERTGGMPAFIGKKMPNALAALALMQFKKLQRYNRRRIQIAHMYRESLADLFENVPEAPNESRHIYLRYTLLTEKRNDLMKFMKKYGIFLGDWYMAPIDPKGVVYESIGYKRDCPKAEYLAERSINLPTHIQLSNSDIMKIINLVKKWHGHKH
jgi:perosamine synthetase